MKFIRERLKRRLQRIARGRPPDVVIGGKDNPYLRRWHLIPRNRYLNAYLHCILRSDPTGPLHDHPWVSASLLLNGNYREHTIAAGGCHGYRVFEEGAWVFRNPRYAHRIELVESECWSLFLTGPRVREWGFHCPSGWQQWQDYLGQNAQIKAFTEEAG